MDGTDGVLALVVLIQDLAGNSVRDEIAVCRHGDGIGQRDVRRQALGIARNETRLAAPAGRRVDPPEYVYRDGSDVSLDQLAAAGDDHPTIRAGGKRLAEVLGRIAIERVRLARVG